MLVALKSEFLSEFTPPTSCTVKHVTKTCQAQNIMVFSNVLGEPVACVELDVDVPESRV